MSGPTPINMSALAGQEALATTKAEIAQQISTEDSFEADAQEAFNAMAAARAQSRANRSRTLEARVQQREEGAAVTDVKRVEKTRNKAEEDLAQQFAKRNSELPADRLLALKDALNEELSQEEIRAKVMEAFPDPTLADEALEFLEAVTLGPLKTKISLVRQLLNKELEREITGGRNIDACAKDYAAQGFGGGSPTVLRDLYRDITGKERDHNTLFALLSRQYAFQQLQEIVNFLLKGMTYDLKSKGPSIPEPLLMRLMSNMRDLQSIVWVYLFFQERLQMMRNLFSREGMTYPEDLNFEVLAKSFMMLAQDRYPSSMKVLKEAERLRLSNDAAKIIVLSQYRDAVRGLAPRLYYSVKHKQDLLVALMDILEQLEPEDDDINTLKKKSKRPPAPPQPPPHQGM